MMQEQISTTATRAEENAKSAHKRIDRQEKRVDELIPLIYKSVANTESLLLQMKEQDERIGELEKAPAENWKNLVQIVIAALVGVAAGSLLPRLFGVVGYYYHYYL